MRNLYILLLFILPLYCFAQLGEEKTNFEKEASALFLTNVDKSLKIYEYLVENTTSVSNKQRYQFAVVKIKIFQSKHQEGIDYLFQLEDDALSLNNSKLLDQYRVLQAAVYTYYGFLNEAKNINEAIYLVSDEERINIQDDLFNFKTDLGISWSNGNDLNSREIDLLKKNLTHEFNFFRRQKILNDLYGYYLSKNEDKTAMVFRNEQFETYEQHKIGIKFARNYLINKIIKNKQEQLQLSLYKNTLILSSFCGLLVFLWLIWQLKIYLSLRNKPTPGIKSPGISDKTELLILERLTIFEQSNIFLNPTFTIGLLAKELGTNVKYLSSTLNSKKNKSFNNYINELRIAYILNCLKSDKRYRTYKIRYLATVSGFVSQSSFTAVFKAVTGKTPSVYIKELSDQEKGLHDEV